MRVLLASNNAHKLREFREILSDWEIVSLREAGLDVDPEETGETFAENAYLKAAAVMKASGMAAIADDSGLCVDALHGEPGVRSARYAGPHETDSAALCAYLLKKLGDEPNRTARFVSCICCVFPDGSTVTAQGSCEGEIVYAPRGENGFGYDPVFAPVEMPGRSMAELTPEEKNAISHRGRSLRAFRREFANREDKV